MLLRVETEGAYASDLLHAELDSSATGKRSVQIKPVDAALATELSLGVLRWRRLLDYTLERELKKPLSKLDLPVTLALRLGLYQLRFLQRVPARAAVSESVELVRRARKSSAASLVNAVLRRCAEGMASRFDAELPPSLPMAERLAILQSHPTWVVERWLARFGEAPTVSLIQANNRAPRLTCAVQAAAQRDAIASELKKVGLRVENGAFLKSTLAVQGGSVTRTDAFRRGAISIQDEASQIIPFLLDVQPGDRVLDLCAAPGGKSAILARAAGPKGTVIAADLYGHRLRAARSQLERLHVSHIRLVQLDAMQPLPFGVKFDRILVDAPCSGTGTLARHPEIRWRLKPEQPAEFHRLQVAILVSALDALAPGGRLVYSTCSLEPEENDAVVSAVVEKAIGTKVRLLSRDEGSRSLAAHLLPGVNGASFFDSDGYFRTIPGTHPTDGFFAAVLQKLR